MTVRPLKDLVVADFGQYVAGACVGQVLADLGATVIKIEPPDGEGCRHNGVFGMSLIREFNRGKRALAIDLKTEAGLEVAWDLLKKSDIVIQNLRPTTMIRLGLGSEDVTARFPSIIYLSFSGFGSRGPSARRAGLDVAAQAESGLMAITGEEGGRPTRVGTPIVDVAAAHYGAEAILAAVIARSSTGHGSVIDVSLLDVAMSLQGVRWAEYFSTGEMPRRGLPKTVAPSGVLLATCDGYIVMSAYAQAHWQQLCHALGRPELLTDPRFIKNEDRAENRFVLHAVLEEAFATMSTEEAFNLLDDAGIVVGRVLDYSAVEASPVVADGGLIQDIGGDERSYRALGVAYTFDGERPAPLTPYPQVGQDTDAILAELGYDEDLVRVLHDQGVVTSAARAEVVA